MCYAQYCRIHQCIDITMLADKLSMGQAEAELWIVNRECALTFVVFSNFNVPSSGCARVYPSVSKAHCS